MNTKELVDLALEYGFDYAGPLNVAGLQVLQDVRDACAKNTCGRYNKSWACPPAFGDLEESRKILQKYKTGIIVQSVQELEDSFDFEGLAELGKRHGKNFKALSARLRQDYKNMIPLGTGGCSTCKECTYPDAPCRFPDQLSYSMEGFGLFVSQVCKDNGLEYNHGPNTMTYSACFFLE